MATNGNKNDNKNDNKFYCSMCGKKYKFRSGLSRHKNKCKKKFVTEKKVAKSRQKVANDNNDVVTISTLQTLTETLAQQGELIEKLIDSQNQMIPKLGIFSLR